MKIYNQLKPCVTFVYLGNATLYYLQISRANFKLYGDLLLASSANQARQVCQARYDSILYITLSGFILPSEV